MSPKTERCTYCGGSAVRTEPFGQQACCDDCFLILIGDDEVVDKKPWRCGNEREARR